MLQTIFLYEWKMLLRNKILLLALVLFTAIACISLNKGVRYYNIQKTAADTVRAGSQRAYLKLKNKFDTSDFTKPERLDIEGVWAVDWSLWEYAVKEENPLSTISIGQNDIYSKIKRTRFATDIFSGEQDEFKNPEQLLTGNLDLSYFILFLFPLLFIAISYNTASADKESAVFKILATQKFSLKSINTARVVFRWLISLLPFVIGIITTYFIINRYSNFTAATFLQFTCIALLYAVFWLSVVLFIVNRGWNSMINILSLSGIWLLLLIGIPGILNSWFQYKYPTNTQQQITKLRDEKAKLYDLPLQTHSAFFASHFPNLIIDTAVTDTAEVKWYGGAIMELQKEKQLLKNLAANVQIQTAKEEQLFWINPVGGVMRALTTISGSSLKQQQNFENHLMNFKQQRADYLIANHASKKHFGKEEFENMPRYKPAVTNQQPIWQYLLPMSLLIVLFFMGSVFSKANKI